MTPNAHALAREFVLFDNFYVDAEVSYDGHAFSTGRVRDRRRREVLADQLRRPRRPYLSEGGGKMRNAYGNVAAPLERLHLGRLRAQEGQRPQLRRVRR